MAIVVLATVTAVVAPVRVFMTIVAFRTAVTTAAITAAATTTKRKDRCDLHTQLLLNLFPRNFCSLDDAPTARNDEDRRHSPPTRFTIPTPRPSALGQKKLPPNG